MSQTPGDKRLLDLAGRLLALTREKRIQWNEADQSGYAFALGTRAGTVTIESVDRDGAMPFMLTLYDEAGRLIDTLSDPVSDPDGRLVSGQLRELYQAVRAQVFDVDKVVDAVLEAIEADLDIPF